MSVFFSSYFSQTYILLIIKAATYDSCTKNNNYNDTTNDQDYIFVHHKVLDLCLIHIRNWSLPWIWFRNIFLFGLDWIRFFYLFSSQRWICWSNRSHGSLLLLNWCCGRSFFILFIFRFLGSCNRLKLLLLRRESSCRFLLDGR